MSLASSSFKDFFGQALFERAAVEDLQSLDLGAVLLDVIAEGADGGLGLFARGGVEALVKDGVDGDVVDGLLMLLLELHEDIAQVRVVERNACGGDEPLLRFLE